ncbi:MAG TPA: DUF1540 domain-containing protein [Oscillospiraceae bacterium]|nr:DUF1540 domain-containing protein [Oscillospiraceae bacterium]HPF55065.1 DUF1540 domain-containing protein [Clostridiales bacterium]HPK34882.1 DUF1540 domain-containing protein [Oscillospiraceae bacterium]HPR76154.1 DUF1540 domain-containing protein [Oscillospiraceae bacterium]
MMENTKKPSTPNADKIDCGVHNCIYHSGKTDCNAKTVKVGPPGGAKRSDQTSCDTFKARESGQPP